MAAKLIDVGQAKCQQLSFDGAIQFRKEQSAGAVNLTGFEIAAYTGAVIERWWGKLAVEISGITCKDKMPIFRDHDRTQIVGYSISTGKGEAFTVKGQFSQSTAASAEVRQLAAEGFPWQASIGVKPVTVLEIQEGTSTVVNGQTVPGPAEVWLESEVYETSFVPLGADGNTGVSVFSEGLHQASRPRSTTGEDQQLRAEWNASKELQEEFAGEFEVFEAYHKLARGGGVVKIRACAGGGNRCQKVYIPLGGDRHV